MNKHFELIDKPTFFGALILLFSVITPLLIFPTEGAEWISIAKSFMTDKLGFAYLALGLAAFFFMIYIVFSDIGQIKLGDPDEDAEFSLGLLGGHAILWWHRGKYPILGND